MERNNKIEIISFFSLFYQSETKKNIIKICTERAITESNYPAVIGCLEMNLFFDEGGKNAGIELGRQCIEFVRIF